MEKRRLTKSVVDGLQAPEKGSSYTWDSECPGFAVRVWRARQDVVRVYVVRISDGKGGSRWMTIGKHGAPWRPHPKSGKPQHLTCELAREEALIIRGLWLSGQDPREKRDRGRAKAEPPERGSCPTLAEFSTRYLRDYSEVHLAYRTAKDHDDKLRLYLLPRLGARRLDTITAADVAHLQAEMKGIPTAANHAVNLLSGIVEKAKEWLELPRNHENPCSSARRFKPNRRERYLSLEELSRLGPALAAMREKHPLAVAAVLVLAFTGARPSEILGLTRERTRLDLGHVLLLRKGKWKPLFLTPPALAVLEMLPGKSGPLFPGVQHYHLAYVWRTARAEAKLEDVRLYDVRHTFASRLINRGRSLKVVQELLGHTNPTTSDRYSHLAEETAREAGAEVAADFDAALKLTAGRRPAE
jgi:integrase